MFDVTVEGCLDGQRNNEYNWYGKYLLFPVFWCHFPSYIWELWTPQSGYSDRKLHPEINKIITSNYMFRQIVSLCFIQCDRIQYPFATTCHQASFNTWDNKTERLLPTWMPRFRTEMVSDVHQLKCDDHCLIKQEKTYKNYSCLHRIPVCINTHKRYVDYVMISIREHRFTNIDFLILWIVNRLSIVRFHVYSDWAPSSPTV